MRNVRVLGSGRGIGAFCSLLNAVTTHFFLQTVEWAVERGARARGRCSMRQIALLSRHLQPPQMRGVGFVKLLKKSHLYRIVYRRQRVPHSLPARGFPCRRASSSRAGVTAAGAEWVKLCLPFQVGAKSHCKMFFPPLALRVVLKLNWFWLTNKNRTAKLNFLRNVVNPVWKINPKMFFPFPHSLACLRPLFACHPSLSAPAVDVSVGGKAGVLMPRCCGEQQWELMGAGTS